MENEKLVRGISRIDLIAITINTIIGAGIFGLPSKVTALIGSYSLFAFIVCAVIVGFIVLCFSEVSSRFKGTGGSYLYAQEAFGPFVGFEVGWLYWMVRVTTFATNCNLFLVYLSFFYPGADQGGIRVLLVTLVVLFMTAVNFVGVRESTVLTNIFTVGKILPLLVFIGVGLFFIQPDNFNFQTAPDSSSFSKAVLMLIYAYVGFEVAAIPGGEIKDPQKNIPIALLTTLGIVALFYILIQVVAMGTLPDLAQSERPLADAAGRFLGFFGGTFISIGALISIFGNLNSGFLTTSRIPFAMAEKKELPEVLGATHKKFKTPHISLLLTAVVILVFTIYTSFLSALTISTLTRLLVYGTTCAALPVFRWRKTGVEEAKFRAPFGLLASIISFLLMGWLFFQVDFGKEGVVILIFLAVGSALFLLFNRLARKPSAENAAHPESEGENDK
ncbi:MAG: APC family permease [Pyrinomonadaceae bacterium]